MAATRVTGALVLSFLLVAAGCVGVLTGSEPLVVESDPVAVSTAAQDDAGYQEVRQEPQPITREVSAAGQSREVQATNHIAEYSRSVSVGPLGTGDFARFVVLSTPAVEVFDRTFNPVGDMSNRELAEEVQTEYEDIENLQSAGERSATVLGTETTVSTYTADGRLIETGESVELTIHVTQVRDEGDFIVIVGVHPTLLDGEADRVDAMIAGIQHDTD